MDTNTNGRSLADLINMFVSKVDVMPGEKGIPADDLVSKNIISGEESTFKRSKKVSPILSSNEIARTYNTGLVLAKAFYDFNIKRKVDTKQGTIVAQAKNKVVAATPPPLPKQSQSDLGLLPLIIGGVVTLATLIGKYFGPVGEFISKAIAKIPGIIKAIKNLNLVSIGKFFTNIGASLSTKFPKISNMISRLKAGSFVKMFKNIGEFFGKKLGSLFKRLPLIGALLNFTFAYQRWKQGKYATSILEILSGIANLSVMFGFLPGALISLAIDGVILLADFIESKKTQKAADGKPTNKSGSFTQLAKDIGKKIADVLWYVPGVSGILYIGRALSKMFNGDISGGIADLGLSIIGTVGGKGLVDFLSWTLGLISSPKTEPNGEIEAKKISFADLISGSIISMLDTFSNLFNETINYSKDLISKGMGIIKDSANSFTNASVDSSNIGLWNPLTPIVDGITNLFKSDIFNDLNQYNPFVAGSNSIIGLNRALEEDERIAKIVAEDRRARLKRKAEKEKTTLDISVEKRINIQSQPKSNKELDEQTSLIKLQNELLVQLVTTSKEQLNVSKKAKPAVAMVESGSKTNNINTNNAFSTNKPDGRSMYISSPYSISPSFA